MSGGESPSASTHHCVPEERNTMPRRTPPTRDAADSLRNHAEAKAKILIPADTEMEI